ncbi:hypothetical protein BGZ89_011494 [Linnemannia elongata]|nr:hypothetical protein BGZ89_011494 [Linnemannia elongata]
MELADSAEDAAHIDILISANLLSGSCRSNSHSSGIPGSVLRRNNRSVMAAGPSRVNQESGTRNLTFLQKELKIFIDATTMLASPVLSHLSVAPDQAPPGQAVQWTRFACVMTGDQEIQDVVY